MVTPAAVARRLRYTAEHSWTGERVREAIRAAWSAYPGQKTAEHSDIVSWPALYLPIEGDLRMALHMMGLAEQGYSLPELIANRLRISRSTFEERIRKGSDLIAEALNRADAAKMAA